MRLFSYRNRPVHKGPYPLEKLARSQVMPDYSKLNGLQQYSMTAGEDPLSIAYALDDYLSLLDSVRDGPVEQSKAQIPDDIGERSRHLKAAGYFLDSAMVGSCALTPDLLLSKKFRHPKINQWMEKGEELTGKLAPMFAMTLARMKMSVQAAQSPLTSHSHALVYLVEYPREPGKDEPGTEWIQGMQARRANLRAAETATALALYLRILGVEARAHSATSSEVDLNKIAVAAGIAEIDDENQISSPYIGRGFGLAVITTSLELQTDLPLARQTLKPKLRSKGIAWWLGLGAPKSAWNWLPFGRRQFRLGSHPMEKVKRVEETTSFIDAERIPRVPKQTEFFIRAAYGDLGEAPKKASVDGYSVMKNPMGKTLAMCLGGYAMLQRATESPNLVSGYQDPKNNADIIKATLHFLGADMVGISEAPDWVWYSHAANGVPIKPAHKFAITTLVDQGHESMDGASGDDWISAALSMRSYMRAALVNGVVTQHLRKLGFPATNHTAADGDVLQPPLMLLSGLGEISRIGDLILNPFLGPRLKCGVITTDFPVEVDQPIDFGLQTFCGGCNKCARECPSGAITSGGKTMFNGYEIWKPDAEKCARYRLTNQAGSMCGRCMKTCPWNLEGIFKEGPYRWLAMNVPKLAGVMMKIDDWLGNGGINPVKKWWWDLCADERGRNLIATDTNTRGLSTDLVLKAEEQTLACYPADLAPPPYPAPFPIDREAGIKAYRALLTPQEHKQRLARGETDGLVPKCVVPEGPPPVMMAMVQKRTPTSPDERVVKFDFTSLDGSPLPKFEAGAHIDVTTVPQFIRQYSLCSDPADSSKYTIGVLKEDDGHGGSLRIHKMLGEGKPTLISRPRNHFPLYDSAKRSLLMAGGIGVTPLIAMAHALHATGKEFVFYYKAKTRAGAGFVEELQNVPWSDRVHFHFSDENRLAVDDVLGDYQEGDHLYTCGPASFMDAVFESALKQGWDEDNLHREYFTAPGGVEYENHAFKLILQKSGVELEVPEHKKATEALLEAGYAIETKCSDGICGACSTHYISGEIEHRDYVLSKEEQKQRVILCCSRAAMPAGEIVLNM